MIINYLRSYPQQVLRTTWTTAVKIICRLHFFLLK